MHLSGARLLTMVDAELLRSTLDRRKSDGRTANVLTAATHRNLAVLMLASQGDPGSVDIELWVHQTGTTKRWERRKRGICNSLSRGGDRVANRTARLAWSIVQCAGSALATVSDAGDIAGGPSWPGQGSPLAIQPPFLSAPEWLSREPSTSAMTTGSMLDNCGLASYNPPIVRYQ
jgi:hypothetical protein